MSLRVLHDSSRVFRSYDVDWFLPNRGASLQLCSAVDGILQHRSADVGVHTVLNVFEVSDELRWCDLGAHLAETRFGRIM